MAEELTLTHERVDDIPLLIGLAQKLHLPEVLDRHLGNHGNHQGLSNGWLATVWLAYILSESDHRKSSVEEWAWQHRQMLERLLGQPIRRTEFNDDRLGIVLRRLSQQAAWEALEDDLWQATVDVYDLEVTSVRLDSTTTYGYHTLTEDGVMQYGHSKDHRPDLPQLKLMAAAAEPSGHLLACDVHPGQAADDPLYRPLLTRVRQMLGRSGLLYVGDSKMAALATRADIVAHGDYYLMPLPLTGETAQQVEAWIDAVVDGEQTVTLIWDEKGLVGGGYEFERPMSAEVDGKPVTWTERVQVVRSLALAEREKPTVGAAPGESGSGSAGADTAPRPGPTTVSGRSGLADSGVPTCWKRYGVTGLLQVTWQREEETVTRYVGRGRGSPKRSVRTEVRVRYVIAEVRRDEEGDSATENIAWDGASR
jgi:hypothetical protein